MIRLFFQNLHSWDAAVCNHIFKWNGKKAIDRTMYFMSKAGDGPLYAVIGVIVYLLNPETGRRLVPAGLLAFVIELPGQIILKKLIRRRRPCVKFQEINNLISLPDEFSFPSGHTAAAFLMASLMSVFFPSFVILFYFLALLIGVSRIYNGVHYPGDVIAGALIGIFCAKTGLVFV